MLIGIYEKAIHNSYNWEDKIKLAKAANFDFIELSIDESNERLARLDWTEQQWLELKTLLNKHQFKINSLCLSAHRKFPLGSIDANIRKKSLAIFDQALKICQIMDIKIIQLAGYDVFYEPQSLQTLTYFLTNLNVISQKAKVANVVIGIETMDTPFMGTCSKIQNYLQEINNTDLKIYPDIGNVSQWTSDPISDLVKHIPLFVQVHLKQTLPNTFRDVAWNAGNVNFEAILSALKQHNYTKDFLVEMWANESMKDYNEQLTSLKQAYSFITNHLKKAGY